MKKYLLLLFFSFSFSFVYCQTGIALKGGVNVAYAVGTTRYITDKAGFHIGLGFNHSISNDVSYEQGFIYSQQGFFAQADTGDTKYAINYITFPFIMKINITENTALLAGPQLSFLINAKKTNDRKRSFNNDYVVNTLDLGFFVGIGTGYNKDVFLEAKYYIGVKDFDASLEYNLHRMGQFTIGHMF